jgi:hypothetical protein
MKTSEVIEKLQELMEKNGDLEVKYLDSDENGAGYLSDISQIQINQDGEVLVVEIF